MKYWKHFKNEEGNMCIIHTNDSLMNCYLDKMIELNYKKELYDIVYYKKTMKSYLERAMEAYDNGDC